MRYYQIVLTDPKTGAIIRPPGFAGLNLPATYTSFVNGRSLPGALNIEFDIPVVPFATPMGGVYIRVWGVSLQEIAQSSQLNGAGAAIYAGMAPGLPLANSLAGKRGLIAQGFVFQAFGNWINTSQSLDLIIYPGTGTNESPKNIVLNWKAGTPLAPALRSTLAVAYPNAKIEIAISADLVPPGDQVGAYATIEQFAEWLKGYTTNLLKGDYRGVDLKIDGTSISAYDGSTPGTPILINFYDLVGQPTWIDFATVQFKCPIRADLQVNSYVKMPPALATTQAGSFSQFRDKSTFSGTFQIVQVRHVGNFRQPEAEAWTTTYDAIPVIGPTTAPGFNTGLGL